MPLVIGTDELYFWEDDLEKAAESLRAQLELFLRREGSCTSGLVRLPWSSLMNPAGGAGLGAGYEEQTYDYRYYSSTSVPDGEGRARTADPSYYAAGHDRSASASASGPSFLDDYSGDGGESEGSSDSTSDGYYFATVSRLDEEARAASSAPGPSFADDYSGDGVESEGASDSTTDGYYFAMVSRLNENARAASASARAAAGAASAPFPAVAVAAATDEEDVLHSSSGTDDEFDGYSDFHPFSAREQLEGYHVDDNGYDDDKVILAPAAEAVAVDDDEKPRSTPASASAPAPATAPEPNFADYWVDRPLGSADGSSSGGYYFAMVSRFSEEASAASASARAAASAASAVATAAASADAVDPSGATADDAADAGDAAAVVYGGSGVSSADEAAGGDPYMSYNDGDDDGGFFFGKTRWSGFSPGVGDGVARVALAKN